MVELVKTMDKWNVNRAGAQLALDLPRGGGRSGTLGHDSFDYITSGENLFSAWKKFCRGKRRRLDVLEFEHQLEANIFALQTDLKSGDYQHGDYQPFTIWDPKQRRIHKAVVRDRLAHQAVVNIIEPLFEQSFIYDSFSCRKGKGTHAGVERLRKFLSQASYGNHRTVYALKCDVHKFFASLEHTKLLNKLSNKIIDPQTLELLSKIIGSFEYTPNCGIPLGNLFANIYMHQFDFFVKHALREKYYVRYCDDFVIVSDSRKHLLELLPPIEEFLGRELELKLHPAKVSLRKWNQGIDFLGYVLKPHCTVLRTKTKRRLLARVTQQNLPSYLGVLSHANSYKLRQELLNKLWLDGQETGSV